MTDLKDIKCEACQPGAPKVTAQEIEKYKPQIPDWDLVTDDGPDKLTRRYETKDFARTLELVNALGDIAEDAGHHPVMLVEFRSVTVWWWSHKIEGLHVNDFVMAARSDEVYRKL